MKPIIMSTEDVRSLLDGRKTMARKAIKFPGDYLVHRYDGPEDNGMHLFAWGHVMPTLHVQVMGVKQTGGVTFCDGYYEVKAPCQPGDVLLVRAGVLAERGVVGVSDAGVCGAAECVGDLGDGGGRPPVCVFADPEAGRVY